MPFYHYKAINRSGESTYGQVNAQHLTTAIKKLQQQQLTPVAIKRQWITLHQAFSSTALIHFTWQLALLLDANMPIDLALEALAKTESARMTQKLIKQIYADVKAGTSLSDSLQAFPQYFSAQYLSFIRAGESSGQLSKTLLKLADLLENQQKITTQIKKTLSYPLFLLICTMMISLGIMLFIIPKYQQFFNELGGHLPWLTRILLKNTHFIQHHFAILLGVFFSLILLLWLGGKQPKLKYRVDRFFAAIPIIRTVILDASFTRWSYLMATACQSNIPLLHAVTLANSTLSNSFLKHKLCQVPQQLIDGIPLHQSLQNTQLFPATVLQMITMGENTGTLTTIFSKISQRYQSNLTSYLARLMKRIEPLIMLLLAVITGIFIAALYLPMINLGMNV